ncbi:MAG: glycosyltransferase family 4 protein [Cytophagaceae bacterium]
MKILFISHQFYPHVGGIEVNSEVLAHEFVKNKHDVKLITWTEDVSGKEFPFTVIRNPSLIKLVKAHIWADIIFENNPSLRLSWPSLLIRKPIVVAVRTWIRRSSGILGRQDKFKLWWLKRACGVIAISKSVQKQTFQKAIVIGNPYRNKLFKNLQGIRKEINFVFLGRLVSDKGADLAIKAMSILLADPQIQLSKPTLTIIGDGPDFEKLNQLVVNLKLEEYIKFTGNLSGDSLVNTLNKHKFLLVPSVWEEPFGNVALEGMACGCLPIVSDGGGLPDAVGKAGVVFKRGDLKDLVEKTKEILGNSELEKKYRMASDEHLANHSPDVVALKYLNVIENSLAK